MNPQMSNEEMAAAMEAQYAQVVAERHEPVKKTHIKKEFTFSVVEKRRVLQQEAVGEISRQAVEDIIRLSVLPRLGITNPKANVVYDAQLGKLTVWEEKEKKAEEPVVEEPIKEPEVNPQ